MKLALVGVGDAGNRIVNKILEYEIKMRRDMSAGNVLVFNTDETSLESLEFVPRDRRIVLGELYTDITDHGVEGDIEVAVSIGAEERDEIRRAFDMIEMYTMDGILLIAGLSGGTGCGIGAVVLEEMDAMFEEPVYVIGILPTEEDGSHSALNAARALRTFVPLADNVLLFDNETWFESDRTKEENYDHVNQILATSITTLFGVGEHMDSEIPETCLDPSDIIQTLDTGGVSSIGYASVDIERDRHWVVAAIRKLWATSNNDKPPDAVMIRELVREALESRLSLPCDPTSADRAILLLSGPSKSFSRKGFESARYWLEESTDIVEIRAGDEPRDRSDSLTAVVLLSNVTSVPRITALQELGVSETQIPQEQSFGWHPVSENYVGSLKE